ncbi:hypothetical protein PQG02_31900 (plasmid) [Nostoc sp. UHCC 0926]|nr:hypothetical protein [Nostoc sp. UHCC 0926]WDD36009.1 hypothetical protein PQG02_31900 [Nostoc sp. UHCC 0926]
MCDRINGQVCAIALFSSKNLVGAIALLPIKVLWLPLYLMLSLNGW